MNWVKNLGISIKESQAPHRGEAIQSDELNVLGLPRVDLALGLALAAFCALNVFLDPWRGPRVVNLVVVPTMGLAIAWRRKAPVAALAYVVACLSVLSILFGFTQSWANVFTLVAATYAAAAYGALRPTIALTLLVSIVAALTDPMVRTFMDAIWTSSLIGLTLLAGLVGRQTHRSNLALDQRARDIELEEEERTKAIVAEERRRIARELHDIISHSLGLVVLQAGAAEQVMESSPQKAREVLRSIRNVGQDAIGEMRTLLGLLRDDPATSHEPQPSLDDLPALVDRMAGAGLKTQLKVEGTGRRLPAAVELNAYRVVQEGLTNASKYAEDANVEVTLRYLPNALAVEVADDGPGTKSGLGGKRGLAGIEERVAVFGGWFNAGPRPEGGWKVSASFPVSS